MNVCTRRHYPKQSHTQSAEEMIAQYNHSVMSNGPKELMGISLVNDFEAYGAYETWNTYFIARAGTKYGMDECLLCALEKLRHAHANNV